MKVLNFLASSLDQIKALPLDWTDRDSRFAPGTLLSDVNKPKDCII